MNMEKKVYTYNSIEQMQQRKEQLREVIGLENKEMKRLWTQLTDESQATRSGQIATFISYGMMAYDGVMMLRKLKRGYGGLMNIFRRK